MHIRRPALKLLLDSDTFAFPDHARIFQQLADNTRLRILYLLYMEDGACVCDLVNALNIPQPKVSRHLSGLRRCRLVKDMRCGTWVTYCLHPSLPNWVRHVLATSFTSFSEQEPFAGDLVAFRRTGTVPQLVDRPDKPWARARLKNW